MTRIKLFTIAVLGTALTLLSIGAVGPATAATDSTTSALVQAQKVRTQVTTLIDHYAKEYGSDVTTMQKRSLNSIQRSAQSELNRLVSAIRKAEQTSKSKDWSKARSAYINAKRTAEQQLDRARMILEPRMGFGEKLQALSDYSVVSRDFDALGSTLGVSPRIKEAQ